MLRALAAAAALLVSAVYAYAEPPPVGIMVRFSAPSIVCKTEEQIVAIYEASRDLGDAGMRAELTSRHAAKECGVARLDGVLIAEVNRLGRTVLGDKPREIWAVYATGSGGGVWIMYGETRDPLPGKST